MAGKKEDENIFSNLVGNIMFNIKPYSPNGAPGNGKADAIDPKATQQEIEMQISEKMAKGMDRSDATIAVFSERMDAIMARLDKNDAKNKAELPRSGIFRWLRRNGNGSAGKKQQGPLAMKK